MTYLQIQLIFRYLSHWIQSINHTTATWSLRVRIYKLALHTRVHARTHANIELHRAPSHWAFETSFSRRPPELRLRCNCNWCASRLCVWWSFHRSVVFLDVVDVTSQFAHTHTHEKNMADRRRRRRKRCTTRDTCEQTAKPRNRSHCGAVIR